jgi:hypothetical protein
MDVGFGVGDITGPLPSYWDLLSDTDKANYLTMRQALSSSACKHCRNHSAAMNQEIIGSIQSFVMRNDGDDWKRGLVCGICWLNSAIAVNTRQLRLLVSKCKSSINSMFQNIGFATIPTTNDYATAIATFFPLIKDNFAELRQWTIRAVKPPDDEDDPPDQPPQDLNLPGQGGVFLTPIPDVDIQAAPGNGSEAGQLPGGC